MTELIYPAFDTNMTRDDMWKHLSERHPRHPWLPAKSTKGELIRLHTRLHISTDLDHEHYASGEDIAVALQETSTDLTVVVVPPLTVSVRRSLKDLVENDYSMLRREIEEYAAAASAAALKEIEAEFVEKTVEAAKILKEAQAQCQAWQHQIDQMVSDAAAQGIKLELTTQRYHGVPEKVTVPGLQEAKSAKQTEIHVEKNRALQKAEKGRLAAQRQVLLSGITQEGLDLLKTIPSAKDMFVKEESDGN